MPPQTTISLAVQTAVCLTRAAGALVRLVAIQLVIPGLYLPPVLVGTQIPKLVVQPPQTIISLPVQTAVCCSRRMGALLIPVAVQLSVLGLYRPPVFVSFDPIYPPQ